MKIAGLIITNKIGKTLKQSGLKQIEKYLKYEEGWHKENFSSRKASLHSLKKMFYFIENHSFTSSANVSLTDKGYFKLQWESGGFNYSIVFEEVCWEAI